MKFSFKIQQYQTDAVNAVVDVFKGQVRSSLGDASYQYDGELLFLVMQMHRLDWIKMNYCKTFKTCRIDIILIGLRAYRRSGQVQS